MNTSLSLTSRAKRISWVTIIRVMPSAASCFTTASTSLTSSGSSAEVISSHSSTRGFIIAKARAIATRLLLPAGELVRIAVELLGQTDLGHHLACDLHGLGPWRLLDHRRREHHVGARGEMREQVELLEHHAHLLRSGRKSFFAGMQRGAVDHDLAAIDRFKAVDGTQQGALARSRCADDGHHFALRDLEIDAL